MGVGGRADVQDAAAAGVFPTNPHGPSGGSCRSGQLTSGLVVGIAQQLAGCLCCVHCDCTCVQLPSACVDCAAVSADARRRDVQHVLGQAPNLSIACCCWSRIMFISPSMASMDQQIITPAKSTRVAAEEQPLSHAVPQSCSPFPQAVKHRHRQELALTHGRTQIPIPEHSRHTLPRLALIIPACGARGAGADAEAHHSSTAYPGRAAARG